MSSWPPVDGGGGGSPTGPAGGDLGSTYPNPTVVSVADVVAGTLGIPHGGTGQVTAQAAIDSLSATVAAGVYLRGNGTHALPTNLLGADISDQAATRSNLNVPLIGDVNAAGAVTKIQGRAVAATAPTDGQVLEWVAANTDWEPAAAATTIGGLPAATLQAGATDVLAIEQSGNGRKIQVQNLRATPIQQALTPNLASFRVFDDFTAINATITVTGTPIPGTGGLILNLVGAGCQATQQDGLSFVPGLLGIETGTSGAGKISYTPHWTRLWQTTDVAYMAVYFKINNQSDGTNTYTIYVGWMNNAGTPNAPTNGFYFQANNNVDTHFRCINNNAGVNTNTSSGIVLDTNFHCLEVLYDGTNAIFLIDGTTVVTQATNLPANGTGLQPAVSVIQTAGATSRRVDTDLYTYSINAANANRSLPLTLH